MQGPPEPDSARSSALDHCDEAAALLRHADGNEESRRRCIEDYDGGTDVEALSTMPGRRRAVGDGTLFVPHRCTQLLWAVPVFLGVLACLALRRPIFGDRAEDSDHDGASRGGRDHVGSDGGSIVTLDADCHTTGMNESCFESVHWAKTQGIYSNPEWYANLTNESDIGEFQMAIHKASPEKCPKPCVGGNKDGKVCPPPQVTDKYGACNEPQAPSLMTFYMYRAQGKDEYPVENLNLADLAGVMWYLQREVVGSRPRKFHIERILRYKVTMKNTDDYFKAFHKQFGPFVAFDEGSAKGRSETWEKYGFVVGCQLVDPDIYSYVPREEMQPGCYPKDSSLCRSGKWYSLPGPCPEEKVDGKTPDCLAKWPGGGCQSAVVTGAHDCTYWAEFAGQIFLDDLEGIDDYNTWWITKNSKGGTIPNENIEYSPHLDKGIGMDFWDEGHSVEAGRKRMDAVAKLFKEKFPAMPATLPEPPCL